MKKVIFLPLLLLSVILYGQVGMGTPNARGALDINKPTTNDAGLVLPTNSNAANIKNPQNNGNPVPGTIFYDSTNSCIRLYLKTGTWSDCFCDNCTVIPKNGLFTTTLPDPFDKESLPKNKKH